MRRIRNIYGEAVTVVLNGIGRNVDAGEIVEIPDDNDSEFSPVYFEDADSPQATPQKKSAKEVATADSASTKEGNS